MKVVSDTSPICYLLLIGHIEILPALFGRIAVPTAVRDELAHPGAVLEVREWILNPPPWLEVHSTLPEPAPGLGRLDTGEREAILLAARLQANLLLLDDGRARRAARERGIAFTGLLGVMNLAAERNILLLPEAVEKLRKTSFRVEPRLLRLLLEGRLYE